MNKQQVSFCGYRCDLCPAYKDNIDKLTKRTTIRKAWNTFFGFDVPEDRMVCVGCGNKGAHLDAECPVRPCARAKHLKNCSFCGYFDSCESLRLRADIIDDIREKHSGQISQEEYALFFRPYEGRYELKKQKRNR